MERKNFSSGAKWEDIVGYSRAVLVRNQLEISGTVATDESGTVGKGDFYLQTKFILQKIERVLQQAGFEMKDVVRTRMFVTDISHWEEVGKALIDPEYLVEIEVTALRSNNHSIDPDASGRMQS